MSSGYTKIENGINLVPQNTTATTVAGDMRYNSSTNKVELYNGGVDPVVTEADTATLTNKTLSGNTATNLINGSGTFDLNSSGTITAPNGTDTLAGIALTQTLTNKTLGSTNTATGINMASFTPDAGSHTLTMPAATDTLVGKATTDTLTNKTIAAGSNTISGLTNSNLSGTAGITVGNGGTGQSTLTTHGVLVGAGTSGITQLAAAAAGTVLTGAGSSSDPAFSATPTLGVNGTTTGQLNMATSAGSGQSITIQNRAGTTAYNFNLPATVGSAGQTLTSQGGGTSDMTWSSSLVNPMTTTGDVIYSSDNSGTAARRGIGSSSQVLGVSGGVPAWTTLQGNTSVFLPPTATIKIITGAQTGRVFTITSGNATAAATYKDNNGAGSNTYTVLQTIASKTTLYCSGSGASPVSPLAKQTGTGDSTITFSASQALATYTVPSGPAPLYLRVKMAGGGGSGGDNGASAGAGGNGKASHFINDTQGTLVRLNGGTGGAIGANGAAGGAGGTYDAANSVTGGFAIIGNNGQAGGDSGNSAGNGPDGGSTAFGPGGLGGRGNTTTGNTGGSAQANSGSGGGGSGPDAGSSSPGSGGGAGAYAEFQMNTLTGTFYYAIGTAGAPANTGTSHGGPAADGQMIIDEYYQ